MKKVITAILICISLTAAAQQKKDTVPQKFYYLVLPLEKWQELYALISTADEKPSVINQWHQIILGAQEIKADPVIDKKVEKKK